jgi:hypothetical protein
MAATKLGIYNQALGHLGERKLASLTEDRESRRVLDDYYAGVLLYCLERTPWDFAMRMVEIDKSNSLTPSFGFQNVFPKPTDWVRTYKISHVPSLDGGPLMFTEELDRWYADCDPLYVQYVSNHATLGGGDLGRWTQAFEDWVIMRLAFKSAMRITNGKADLEVLAMLDGKALKEARELNRAGDHPEFPPQGTWVASRGGNGRGSRWDRKAF